MSDRETLELDEILEKITFYCFEEARKKIEAGEDVVPFTAVVSDDQMFIENYPGDDVESCRNDAQANVKSSSTFSTHYAFCYDGFLETDEGNVDAVIVECATRDMEKAYVIGLLYTNDGGVLEFTETPAYIADAESFYDFAAVRAAKEREAVTADDGDFTAAQEMLKRNLSGSEEEQ